MTETLPNGYSYESNPMHTNMTGFEIVFQNLCILVHRTDIASALEGLIFHSYLPLMIVCWSDPDTPSWVKWAAIGAPPAPVCRTRPGHKKLLSKLHLMAIFSVAPNGIERVEGGFATVSQVGRKSR